MFALALGFLTPLVGGLFARVIIGVVLMAAIAVPFAYTYHAGYSNGKEHCEAAHRAAFDAAQKEADKTADELQDQAIKAEDDFSTEEQRDISQLPALAAAIERGASSAQCIDADSMQFIAGSSDADVATSRNARARQARSK